MTLGDKPLAQFLHEAEAIVDELAVANTPLSSDEFNAIIFRLLSSDYRSAVATLSAEKSQVSFSDLSGRFMAHEILLQSSHKPIIVVNAARQHTSSARPSNQSFQKNNTYRNNDVSTTGNKKCFSNPCKICGLNNHQVKWCRKCYNRDNTNAITLLLLPTIGFLTLLLLIT
ncbi:hypothetical protein P3L10_023025 [Capsicum annuum]|uniref:uncharacterized protein LOC124886649 n=1 Tax=Capsicum annuum TaxID=4072 RepID=UPI001FB1840C|nr:uncharacterized protein LOC124886649 [Capsicum annuum]